MAEEQWSLEDSETIVGTCERCGKHDVPLQLCYDPFELEGIIDGDGYPEHWCRPCFVERCGDI